jgi:hypothetical protein
MGSSPGALGAQVPLGPDYFSRTVRDQERNQREQAAARILDASTIGNGGVMTCNGSLIVNGSLTVPSGALNTAFAITAGTSVTAGTSLNGNSLAIIAAATIGGTLSVTGAVTGASFAATGNVSASGQVISAGIITSPGTKSNTVTVGYSAVYIDSSGNMGGNTSSRRFKTNIGPAGYDLDAFLALPAYSYQRTTDILELGASAAPWFDGMMAEDVAPILPLHVWYDENGLVEGIRFEELVTPLIQAVARERHQRRVMQSYYEGRLAALEKAAGIVPPAPPGA